MVRGLAYGTYSNGSILYGFISFQIHVGCLVHGFINMPDSSLYSGSQIILGMVIVSIVRTIGNSQTQKQFHKAFEP